MAKSDSLQPVLDIINEVRKLLGYSTITELDSDRYGEIHLRLLNELITIISDKRDWPQQHRTASVTATTSIARYSIGTTEPVKRIEEISFDNDSQALYNIKLDKFNRYSRTGGVGRPRFFNIKEIDTQGNPFFHVFRQPGTAENGLLFSIEYFIAPRLYDTSSTDEEVPFPANMVIQGLYAKALLEQNGNTETREYLLAKGEFDTMLEEAANRYTNDTGTDTQLQPPRK